MLEGALKDIKHIIAGGFARDINHGKQPRDLDIIAVGATVEELDKILDPYLDLNKVAPDLNYETCGRIIEVWALKGNIDVILYDASTLREAIAMFDYNINQYVCVGSQIEYWGENEGTLVRLREDLHPERIDKMEKIAKSLNWAVTGK